jgi:cleavage stimulation factor subunit 2
MVNAGSGQPMQIMYTPDGQQIMVPPGMPPPAGMVLAAPPPGAVPLQPQPQPMFAGPSPHLQQPGLAPPMQQQAPPPPPAAAAAPPGGGDSTKDLLRQVMVMTDEQINALPEEYRNQVLYVKEQIRIGALKVD